MRTRGVLVWVFLCLPTASHGQAGIADPANSDSRPVVQSRDGGSLGQREQGAIDSKTPSTPGEHEKLSGAAYTLWKLHHLNYDVLKAGQLALGQSKSKVVRAYSQRLIGNQQQTDQKVLATAREQKVDLEAHLAGREEADSRQMQRDLDALQSLKGSAFDEKFLSLMMTAHKDIRRLLTDAQRDDVQSTIRPLIDELLPKLIEQEQMVAAMSKHSRR